MHSQSPNRAALSQANQPPRWNIWPIAITSFFGVAIIGFAAFVVFCNLHPSELVRGDYYEQELRYQKQIERLERTARSAPAAAVTYDKARRVITVAIPLSHANAGASGTIHFYRPSEAALDKQLPLHIGPDATQTIDARVLPPGFWRVQVLWKAGGQDYCLEQKLTLES